MSSNLWHLTKVYNLDKSKVISNNILYDIVKISELKIGKVVNYQDKHAAIIRNIISGTIDETKTNFYMNSNQSYCY